MRDRFLLPQLGEIRFVHELPLVELCNGLVAGALTSGFERLEILAPQHGAAIAEIRGYKGESGSQYFALPASMHRQVVRRFKAMAKMRRVRPADTQGVIQFQRVPSKPIAIPVKLGPRADGQADVIMTLKGRGR
jgi:hypothetical protein